MMKQNAIPVFLSSDNNYVPYMTALMVSIMDNTESLVDFYIVDGGINGYYKKEISKLQKKLGFGLEFINAAEYRHLFKLPATPSGHITRASSDRFLIPYMKPELDKGIILDVDMIALGDIKKLWEIDLEGNLLAAVPVYCWTNIDTLKIHCKETGMSDKHIYLNMGTLLVDFKKWREDNMLDKLSSTPIRFNTNIFSWWDEILINLVLQNNKYKILDPKFNMMIPHQAYYKSGKPESHKKIIEDYCGCPGNYKVDEIIFSHYAMRQVKPWNTDSYLYPETNELMDLPDFKAFWHYMKMTPFYEEEMVSFQSKQIKNISKIVNSCFKNNKKYSQYGFLNALTLGLVSSIKRKKKKYKKLIS